MITRCAAVLLSAVACLRLSAGEAPDIAFLDVEQARVAIADESVEPYFSRLQPLEMAAKTGSVVPGATLDEKRAACRERYRKAVRAFSADEQHAMRAVVASAQPALAKFPLFAAEPWRFLKVDTSLEGGLPHTRGHCIVLSDEVLPMISARTGAINAEAVELLVHEQTHVVQRLHPQPFAVLYTATWGFVRMAHEPRPTAALLAHQLMNPDGMDCVWAFPIYQGPAVRWIQPLVTLTGDGDVPNMPGDFAELGLEVAAQGAEHVYRLGADGEATSEPLHGVRAYVQAFAPADEIFHPNEIAAVLFSHLVVHDLIAADQPLPEILTKVQRWGETQLILNGAKAR